MDKTDRALQRLLAYHGIRFWLTNGWSLSFRVRLVPRTQGQPHGVKYSLCLHDEAGLRILGYDNAHGLPRRVEWDHKHLFRKVEKLVPYRFIDTDQLLVDFFTEVKRCCALEGVPDDYDGRVDVDQLPNPDDWEA